jgi:hypothetical protein
LFSRIDNDLWERLAHNPILLLRKLERSALNEVAQDSQYLALYDSVFASFDNLPQGHLVGADTPKHPHPIAYFSVIWFARTLPIFGAGCVRRSPEGASTWVAVGRLG